MDLSRKPEVAALIGEEIAKANASLPDVQQVKRFLLLNKELEADDAEMTRTRKVRRRFVAEKYASVIEAFYGGKSRGRGHHGDHLRGRPQVDAELDHRDPRHRARPQPVRRGGLRERRCPRIWNSPSRWSLSGASIGLMYSLIALGFVLVYKATDAINFAQGEFVMLAGLIVVTVLGFAGAPLIAAIVVVAGWR